jgi:hypothetical protein
VVVLLWKALIALISLQAPLMQGVLVGEYLHDLTHFIM